MKHAILLQRILLQQSTKYLTTFSGGKFLSFLSNFPRTKKLRSTAAEVGLALLQVTVESGRYVVTTPLHDCLYIRVRA